MTREEYYKALEKSKELYHHGIKGQKWGIENGPPYPLDGDGKAAIKQQRRQNPEVIRAKANSKIRKGEQKIHRAGKWTAAAVANIGVGGAIILGGAETAMFGVPLAAIGAFSGVIAAGKAISGSVLKHNGYKKLKDL